MADLQRTQPSAAALGDEVAALEREQLLTAQPGVAEHPHDRDVAPAHQRVATNDRLCLGYQPLPGQLRQRPRALALALCRGGQTPRQRQPRLVALDQPVLRARTE